MRKSEFRGCVQDGVLGIHVLPMRVSKVAVNVKLGLRYRFPLTYRLYIE